MLAAATVVSAGICFHSPYNQAETVGTAEVKLNYRVIDDGNIHYDCMSAPSDYKFLENYVEKNSLEPLQYMEEFLGIGEDGMLNSYLISFEVSPEGYIYTRC